MSTSLIINSITPPPLDYLMLNKLGFGPSAWSLERFNQLGLKGYIEEQLKPDESADDLLNKKLKECYYPIEYEQFSADG